MSATRTLFATKLYRAEIAGRGSAFNARVAEACAAIATEDRAGQAWSKAHGYRGYTSYGSLTDLSAYQPAMAELSQRLAAHATRFARAIDLDLGRRKLVLDNLWINILKPGGHHSAHIHPHCVVSGTYYVAVPDGASAIRFEDPRHGLMMAAPLRKPAARLDNRTFVDIAPKPGTLLLWESWLRHEVPVNGARRERVSVSFNFRW